MYEKIQKILFKISDLTKVEQMNSLVKLYGCSLAQVIFKKKIRELDLRSFERLRIRPKSGFYFGLDSHHSRGVRIYKLTF